MNINNLFNLENKVAVVTGGYGYLGTSMVEALAEAGAQVYITGKNSNKCKQLSNKLNNLIPNAKIDWITLDISSSKSIKNAFKHILRNSKKIDILINNAFFGTTRNVEKISESEWEMGIQGSINGVFKTTNEIIPIMKKFNSGTIINIASMYGQVSPDPSIYGKTNFNNPPQYGAGKAAIIQFTRYSAVHLAKNGIRVNSISPGPFPNPEVQKNKKFIGQLNKKTPMNRVGKPWEIKGIVIFLSSNASTYVTGQNINVDGGWTVW